MYSQKNGISKTALENAVSDYIGAGSAILLNSGTAAMHLALRLAAGEVYGIPISVYSGKQESIATGLPEERGSGMRSAGSLQGRRVFCPDLAPASLALPILREGGEPVFIDISPCDWCMDPEALETAFALYPDVKIVLMTHLYGFPGQIREIKEVCLRHGAVLIEDVSDALGASIGGRMAGSFGDYGILDFGKGKIVSADAGGMLLMNGRSGAASLAALETMTSGATKEAASESGFAGHAPSGLLQVRSRMRRCASEPIDIEAMGYFPSKTGTIAYGVVYTGYGKDAAEAVCADLGVGSASAHAAKRILSELPHLPERIARKKEIYENYRELLDGELMYMNPVGAGTEPNYWMPCITCESAIPFREWRTEGAYGYENPHGTSSPMEIYDALRACGISSRPLYRPLSQQPAFRGCEQVSLDGSRQGFTANAEAEMLDAAPVSDVFWERCDWSRQISNTGLCLPSDVGMTREEQERVAEIIYSCFDAWQGGTPLEAAYRSAFFGWHGHAG